MSAEIDLPAASRPLRVNGIVVLAVLVAAGMGVTSVYYHIKAPAVLAQRRRELESLPKTPEGRVDHWVEMCAPLVDSGLVALRIAPNRPWIVSHVVTSSAGEAAQEIWGVDIDEHSTAWTAREGANVVVTLPAAKLLGHGPIQGDKALNVPRYAAGSAIPDPDERVRQIVEWEMRLLVKGLVEDTTARLIVRVGDSATPESALQNEGK